MKLTWKDALSTVLVLAGLAIALSVTGGWNWPLIGGVREAIVALAVAGLASCLLGTPLERWYYTDPFGLLTVAIVVLVLIVATIGGLIFATQQYLVLLMIVTGMLWLFATLRHAIEGRPQGTPTRTALS